MIDTIRIESHKRDEFVNITRQVQKLVSQSGIEWGYCTVYVPHTTAAVCVNESADPAVSRDILTYLNRLVPEKGDYMHLEGNADAHIKAVLVGSTVVIPIQQHELDLGTWQGIFFCEFDGPRKRQFKVGIATWPAN